MKKYIQITVQIPEEYQEIAIQKISNFDFTGIEQNNDLLTINFLATKTNENIHQELLYSMKSKLFDIELVNIKTINEENWNQKWENSIEGIVVDDDIAIAPEWKASNYNKYKYLIKINPKMSFGTGEHATTRMAAKLLKYSVSKNDYWLDSGTGTGILAILISMLGANKVDAIDIDNWSIKNSEENFLLNDINNINLRKVNLNDYKLPSYDGIIANMFSNIIISNMIKFYNSLKVNNGTLICTGIMKYDSDKVIEVAKNAGFNLTKELSENEWKAFKFEVK